MDKVEKVGTVTTSLLTAGTIIQWDVILSYVQLGLAILVGVATLIYTIIKTIKLAKSDGVIDAEETQEIVSTAVKGSVNLWSKIKHLFSKKESKGKENPQDGKDQDSSRDIRQNSRKD